MASQILKKLLELPNFICPMSKTTSRTLNDFQQDLAKQNKSVRQWAKEKGFDLSTVYAVCHGRTKGHFGASRQVMKAMGLPVPKV